MKSFRLSALIAAMAFALLIAPQCLAQTAHPQPHAKPHAPKHGHKLSEQEIMQRQADTHVYLLRGLFGIFSTGMDDLAGKLKVQGYRAAVYQWDNWGAVVNAIHGNYQKGHRGPVVVIGHSLGANVTFDVASDLQGKQIPVLLGVIFDATERRQVPANVDTFMNFYSRKDGYGHSADPGPGFTGLIENHDLSETGVSHVSIDQLVPYHNMVMDKLANLISR